MELCSGDRTGDGQKGGAIQKWQGAMTGNSCKFRDEADQGERQRGKGTAV